jgi:carbon storage regulator
VLVLTRRLREEIVIGATVRVTVLSVKGGVVRLGVEAPPSVRVVRQELLAPSVARPLLRRRRPPRDEARP